MLFVITKTAFSQVVSNNSQLQTAIGNAQPGSKITLANRVWNDLSIVLNKNGTANNSIVITAETPGNVFIEGNSNIVLSGSYLELSGLVFRNASGLNTATKMTPIIELDGCDNCIITNNKIDAYNGSEDQSKNVFKWILVDGKRNEISYNSFLGKNGIGSIINDNRKDNSANYTKIHHNYFANRTPTGGILNEFNNQDAIRIGTSGTSLSNSFSEVYENYFYNFISEVEVISNKSGANKYYNNTFRDYAGSLTLRHGNNCEIYGNFFFPGNNAYSGAVRIIGEGHKVYNNYIEQVDTYNGLRLSQAAGGINITNGKINPELNGYHQVKDAIIINNTFVNCGYGIRMGTKIKADLTLAPSNVEVSNNIFLNTLANAYEELTKPTNSIIQGNIKQSGIWDLVNGSNQNITVDSGLLVTGSNFYKVPSGSDAIGYGIGDFPFLTNDILGGSRSSSNFDAGAEEFGANGTRSPFKASDVGVIVGFLGDGPAQVLSTSTNTSSFSKKPSTNTFNIFSNGAWEITTNSSWLTVSPTSGTGDRVISVSVLENTTGNNREDDIIISQRIGALTKTVSISQFKIDYVPTEIIPISVSGKGSQAPNNPVNVLDNVFITRWSGNSGTGDAYLDFDLGCKQLVTSVRIQFHNGQQRQSSFKILTSSDNISYQDVTGILKSSGTTVDYERFDFSSSLNTQYFRIQGLGNSSSSPNNSVYNSYLEVEILGKPIDCDVLSVEEENLNSITIYPIPVTQGELMIKSPKININTITIFSITGKLLTNNNYTRNTNSVTLDLKTFNSGVYFLNINNTVTTKIVID